MGQLNREIKELCTALGYSPAKHQSLIKGITDEEELLDVYYDLLTACSEADSQDYHSDDDDDEYSYEPQAKVKSKPSGSGNMGQTNIVSRWATVWDYHKNGHYICIPTFGDSFALTGDNFMLKTLEGHYPGTKALLDSYAEKYGQRVFVLSDLEIIILPLGRIDCLDETVIRQSCDQANGSAAKKDLEGIQVAMFGPVGIAESLAGLLSWRFDALGPTKQARRSDRVRLLGAHLLFTTGSEEGIECPKCQNVFRVANDTDASVCPLCNKPFIDKRVFRMPEELPAIGAKGGGKRLSLSEIAAEIKFCGGQFLGTVGQPTLPLKGEGLE